MMIFSEDTKIVRSSLTMIASYLAFLLEAGKSKHLSSFIISPVRALSLSPRPTPTCHEAASTFRANKSELSGSISSRGISFKKSTSTCPFNTRRGLN